MKNGMLIIRVSKGKTGSNSNILGQDTYHNSR